MRYKKASKVSIPLILILFLLFWIFNKNPGIINNEPSVLKDGSMAVHFIDAGQGDCELIQLPDGTVMLIDAGDNGKEDIIISYIDSLGIDKIDYLIATHPHADHIGGMK